MQKAFRTNSAEVFVTPTDKSDKSFSEIQQELKKLKISFSITHRKNYNSLKAVVTRFTGRGKLSFIFKAHQLKNGTSAFCNRTDSLSHGFYMGDSALNHFKNEVKNSIESNIYTIPSGGMSPAAGYIGFY